MIDKNGKLFGKINIIDLLIVLVVIAALVLVATRMFTPGEKGERVESTKVTLTYVAVDALIGAGEAINVGDPVYEDTTNIELGTVTSVQYEEAYQYQAGPDGEVIKVPVVGREYVTVTTEVEGHVTDNGIYVEDYLYCIGVARTYHFGQTVIYGVLTDISPVA